MAKAETEIPLSPRARTTLEKYRDPTVVERDTTPGIEKAFLAKSPKWIDRTGWKPGNYPIYTITDEGELALSVDTIHKKLRKREIEIPEAYYKTRKLDERLKILTELEEATKIRRRI